MSFENFAQLVKRRFDSLAVKQLYEVKADKDEVWDLYLKSFPEGTNPIYLKNAEHDCSTCKSQKG